MTIERHPLLDGEPVSKETKTVHEASVRRSQIKNGMRLQRLRKEQEILEGRKAEVEGELRRIDQPEAVLRVRSRPQADATMERKTWRRANT